MASEKSELLLESIIETTLLIVSVVKDPVVPRSIADQAIRSISSIGANFSEAQEASSRKDFVNKIYIAKKEAQETRYWLRIIKRMTHVDVKIEDEVSRYIMTLQKILTTTKENH